MNGIAIAKAAARTIVGMGTSKVVSGIIKTNVPRETPVDTVTVVAASIVIGSMVQEATSKYTDKMIDDIVRTMREMKSQNDN